MMPLRHLAPVVGIAAAAVLALAAHAEAENRPQICATVERLTGEEGRDFVRGFPQGDAMPEVPPLLPDFDLCRVTNFHASPPSFSCHATQDGTGDIDVDLRQAVADFAELVELLAACGMQIGEVTEEKDHGSYCVHADVGWDGYHEAELEVSGCAADKVMLDLTATWWSRSADQQ